MDTLLQDLRYALRTLARSPGFAAVAVLSLALGIGANTTVFSLVNAVRLRPLPYAEPGRLVDVEESNPRALCPGCAVGVAYPTYLEWRAEARSFSAMGAYQERPFTLTGGETPEQVGGAVVSAGLWATLGVRPALGRSFLAEEDRAGATPAALISHELWERTFAASPAAIGSTVALDGVARTIVGVMPAGFRFPEAAHVWVPLGPEAHAAGRDQRELGVVGRLRDGATLDAARAELASLAARTAAAHPATNQGWSAGVTPLRAAVADDSVPAFAVLMGAVGCVLLIACANLAGLLLARGTGRRRELAVRAALGASRGRIVRQLLTESVLIALAGGTLGVLLSEWGIGLAVGTIQAEMIPFWIRFGIDWRVLAFALAASVGTGIAFGLAPALRASRTDLHGALKEGARGSGAGGGARPGRLRGALVVSEIALSLLLLAGAGLMVRTFLRVSAHDPGYDARGLLTAELALREPRWDDPAQVALLGSRVAERLQGVAGARAAAVYGTVFLAGFGAELSRVRAEGVDAVPDGASPTFAYAVTPAYFETLGVPLLGGRSFADGDRAGAPGVVVLNRAMAERLWPGQSPLGRRIRLRDDPAEPWLTVVGVAGNVAGSPLAAQRRVPSYAYVPLAQRPERSLSVLVRTAGEPTALSAAVRRAVAEVAPAQPLTGVRSVEQAMRQWVWPVRMYATFLGAFAVFAVLLAAIGIYGVVAYAVGQRTHEIGVRMALGARAGDVLRLVLRQGVALGVIGVGIGLAGALAGTRLLRAILFGTSSTDPLTLAAVTGLLLGVVVLASWIPARRATRVDPMVALRAD